ncbi:type IX secretion system membrane protein PorP/SprF [Ichthyenterobacterium sp. W332]|uniref:Type IX secretion system membrane protein PorP/SprF n=1 Tax=Microcosmobacter mediterraneus TaxID=3075607 RepID=A0ABU2YK01_9FLAO|nr:type IX secretion system membrane protein PorP/SprF [Ichthyenterobacterium sp. W332]MDT0558502.1 type IX secretion system membrane protein PorP/SprF [Ichthyenterobacterium sp. W332]
MNLKIEKLVGLVMLMSAYIGFAQQDPQFTNYMYNPMSVNSAYAGNRGHLTVFGLHRTQWVGLDGAPTTQSFTIDTPVGRNVGLGLSIVNDRLGPSDEFYIDGNFSYTINVSDTKRLSFGIKAGGRMLNIDWSRGQFQNPDAVFQQNIRNKFLPTVGAGLYLHGERSYLGLSVPNFFTDQHYDDIQQSVAAERLHFFLIGGTVFDLSERTKFKPAFLVKHVVGAPLIFDLSANFMFNDNFRLGLAYRWDDSVSGLIGFQLTPQLLLGYSYDYTTTELQNFNTGTHEIMLRFELKSKERQLKSPRFF